MRRFRETVSMLQILSFCLFPAAFLGGCNSEGEQERLPPPGAGSSLVTSGEKIELNCFSFVFKNTFKRPVVDVHIPLDGSVVVATPPPGWAETGDGGVKFETPPPSAGTTTERPRPVPPGGISGTFTFCLAADGPTEGGPIELSFAEGANEPVTDIWQGGEPVPVGPDGLKHIKKRDKAFCQELELTAPDNAEVKDIHLDRVPGGNPTDFIGVDLPDGWVSNPVDPGSVTIFTEGGGPGVAPGEKLKFKVCYKSPNASANWRLTDGSNRTIDGAEGRINLF